MRTCSRCKQEKQHSEFYERKDARPRAQTRFGVCKRCKIDEQMDRHWVRKYGVTKADVDRMFAEQGGNCAICGGAMLQGMGAGHRSGAHLDHDHRTGVVRKLLCRGCNLGLGYFDDNAERLAAAINYVKEHQ